MLTHELNLVMHRKEDIQHCLTAVNGTIDSYDESRVDYLRYLNLYKIAQVTYQALDAELSPSL